MKDIVEAAVAAAAKSGVQTTVLVIGASPSRHLGESHTAAGGGGTLEELRAEARSDAVEKLDLEYIETLKASVARLKSERDTAIESREKLSQIAATLDKARGDANVEIEALKKQLALAATPGTASEIADLAKSFYALRTEHDVLLKKFEEQGTALVTVTSACNKLETERGEMLKRLDAYKAAAPLTVANTSELMDKLAAVTAQRDEASAKLLTITTERDQLKAGANGHAGPPEKLPAQLVPAKLDEQSIGLLGLPEKVVAACLKHNLGTIGALRASAASGALAELDGVTGKIAKTIYARLIGVFPPAEAAPPTTPQGAPGAVQVPAQPDAPIDPAAVVPPGIKVRNWRDVAAVGRAKEIRADDTHVAAENALKALPAKPELTAEAERYIEALLAQRDLEKREGNFTTASAAFAWQLGLDKLRGPFQEKFKQAGLEAFWPEIEAAAQALNAPKQKAPAAPAGAP